jgi:P4 family phage/plasmid primase-like protien
MHWNGQRWLCLGDELLRELVRSRLRELSIPIRRSLLVNVSNLIKDRTFNLNKRFNISKDHIVSVLNGDLLYLDGKWTLTPPERDRMRTTLLPHMYDPDATTPGFMQFLDDIFYGDADAHEKSSLVLQHMGYALQTHTNLERFAIYVGTGGNGKSILLNTLKELVGIENVAAVQPHMLKSSFHRASLNNKLANIITESDQGGKLPAAEIKALVSGEAMTVDHKFGHPFVMEPFATLFWATNHLPYPHDYSGALYRRVDIVEFNRKFEGQDRNLNLRHELREEMPGILNAALEAYAAVIRNDFEEPISVSEAKAKWRKNSNPVACWAEERLERSMLAELQSKLAYEDFNEWRDENGHKLALTQTTFSERLKLLGHEKVRKNKAVFWRDVQLVK